MGLYTKIDKQMDNYYEVVSIKKVIIKTKLLFKSYSFITFNFYCLSDCEIVSNFLILKVFVVGERFI